MPAGYVFDAYGTLFDVHSAVRHHADALEDKGARLSQIWRAKQLEYSWIRALMGSYSSFWRLTQEALDFAMASTGIDDDALRESLLDTYWTLDAYPEVADTLARLREKGARLAILSNGSPEMLQAAIDSAGIGAHLDDVFSVDAIKTFKTAPEVYRMVTDSWEVQPSEVAFQSSNRWDVAAATKFGFETNWINRTGQPDEYLQYKPNAILPDLSAL